MAAGRPRKPVQELMYTGTYNPKKHGDRGAELDGDIVCSIENPKDISPVAQELFQSFVNPLCLRKLVFKQDLAVLIPAAYILDNIIWLRNQIETTTSKTERLTFISAMNKSIKEFSSIAYKWYVSPVERARAVSIASSVSSPMSLAERMKNAKKES